MPNDKTKSKNPPFFRWKADVNKMLAQHEDRLDAAEEELKEHNRDIGMLADICMRARRRDAGRIRLIVRRRR